MESTQFINHSDTPGLAGSHLERMNDHASTLPAMLRLPRELRDLIYEHYVQVDGGYIHNFETNRLLQADGSPISTGLALTCRQIAAEMQGLALGQNTITFYTHFSESSRQQAGLFQMTMYTLMFRKKVQLQHLIPRLLSYDMVQRAIDAYPQFARIFDGWMPHQSIVALHQRDFDCGEAPSTWDDFIQYVFHLLSKHPAFHDEMVPMPRTWKPGEVCDLRALSETSPAPWLIPDLPDLSRLASIADVEPGVPMYYPRPEYRHSAASVALRFLHAIPSSSLSQVRTVILQEDCESGVNAASHGRGFIPLCQFNRRLRVQRIVNMWSSVFRPRPASRIDYVTAMDGDTPDRMKDDRLYSSTITKAVGTWIAEAQALPSLGMPRDSLSVLLDGSPTIEHTQKVFKIVQRDVAWQSALDAAYARGLLPTPSWYERRTRVGYQYEGLPAAIRSMSPEGGPISCNFDIGQPEDVESVLRLHHGWSLQQWQQDWNRHQSHSFQTEYPLPPWHVLKWLRVMMEW